MNIVGAFSQIGSVRLYLTSAGSKARPVKVLVHVDATVLVDGKMRTVVTTASHLELMCSCDLKVGIGWVVSFTPSIDLAVADVRGCQGIHFDITCRQT